MGVKRSSFGKKRTSLYRGSSYRGSTVEEEKGLLRIHVFKNVGEQYVIMSVLSTNLRKYLYSNNSGISNSEVLSFGRRHNHFHPIHRP